MLEPFLFALWSITILILFLFTIKAVKEYKKIGGNLIKHFFYFLSKDEAALIIISFTILYTLFYLSEWIH